MARTLFDMRDTWEITTKEERMDLVHTMIQEFGFDVADEFDLWVKTRLEYESLFSSRNSTGHLQLRWGRAAAARLYRTEER